MLSPKSHQHKERKESYRRREHKNKKFYNSRAWRETRAAYMRHYRDKLFREIPKGKWRDIGLTGHQVSYILSLSWLPCERCLRLYSVDAYDKIDKGVELDHIIPVNNEDALKSKGYGDPFSFDNLQLLCKRHHAKKSQRER